MRAPVSRLFAFLLLVPAIARAQPLGQTPPGDSFVPNELPGPEPSPEPPPPAAPEPAAPRFGAPGEVVATFAAGGANGGLVSYEQFSNSQATYLSANVDVGLDYFVVRNLSIGFDLEASHSDDTGYASDGSLVANKDDGLSVGVRFGANVPLAERFSFYPRLTLGVEGSREVQSVVTGNAGSTSNAVGSPATTSVGPWVNLFAPLLFHPTPHFFLGVGPRVVHHFADVSGAPSGVSAQSTTLEAALVLGGVWSGDEPARDAAAPPVAEPGARLRRFGDQGTFVITSETDGYFSSTSWAGTGSSSTSLWLRPGFDVFLVEHFSLGLDVSVGYTRSVSLSAGGAQVVYVGRSFGLAPRAGVEVPLLSWLCWYPRAEIGFGSTTQNESSAGATNDHTYTQTWVALEAPLIAHVARHFFAGLGPSVSHDLANQDQYGYVNLGTTLGVSTVLGGWL
jgi:hypothetical protein